MADIFPDVEEVIKEASEIFKSQGANGLIKHFTHNLNIWNHVNIKIAVTGNSGAGISSLINALRVLHQSDENAAMEGVRERTTRRTVYAFPGNNCIELHDLPGVGTLSHPIESYMQDMNFKQYDFVLIVSSQRFSQNDALIIKELQHLKMPFYLVRSKILVDVENQKFTQTRDEVLNIIRGDCCLNLQRLGVEAKCVFLIDSHVHQDFELGKLQVSLNHAARDTFQDTPILTVKTMTKKIIGEKVKVLKRRAVRVAFMAIVSAVPGANYFLNEIVLEDEISFYKTELGLDDEAIGETCNYLEVDRTRLQDIIAFCDFVIFPEKAIQYINNFKEKLDNSPGSSNYLLFGSGRALSTYHGLLNIIDTSEKDSLKISEHVLETVRGSRYA